MEASIRIRQDVARQGVVSASPRRRADIDGLRKSRRRTALAGAGGAAAAPWTSVVGGVAAARARGAASTWQRGKCA